jgi:hypothetical protein
MTETAWGPRIPHKKAKCPVPKGTRIRACVNNYVLEGRVSNTKPEDWAGVTWYQTPQLQAMTDLIALAANPTDKPLIGLEK